MHGRLRAMTLGGMTVLTTALVGVLPATPAAAHSALVSTEPVAGTQLASPPTAVTLHFDGGVVAGDGSLRVVDGAGRRVDARPAYRPTADPATVRVDLAAGLTRGAYVVRWRVVSVDGHPVAGTFSFGLGVPADDAPASAGTSALVSTLHGLAALAAYLGAMLLVGVACFALAVWPAALTDGRARTLLRAGWWLSLGSAVPLLLLQGPLDSGGSLLDLRDVGLLGQTLTTRPGLLLAGRIFVLGLVAAAGPWPGTEPLPALRRNAGAMALLFLPTFSLSGHAGEGRLAPLSVLTDTLHLGAAALWVGGLATLVTIAPEAPDGVWARWTPWARTAVAALAITGAFQAWRQLPDAAALPGTGYGRLLLVKLALVTVMLALADQARRRLRLPPPPDRAPSNPAPSGPAASAVTRLRPISRLRRAVAAELALGVAVLCVTTLLVGRTPARVAAAGSSAPPGLSHQVTSGDKAHRIPDVRGYGQSPRLATVRVQIVNGMAHGYLA